MAVPDLVEGDPDAHRDLVAATVPVNSTVLPEDACPLPDPVVRCAWLPHRREPVTVRLPALTVDVPAALLGPAMASSVSAALGRDLRRDLCLDAGRAPVARSQPATHDPMGDRRAGAPRRPASWCRYSIAPCLIALPSATRRPRHCRGQRLHVRAHRGGCLVSLVVMPTGSIGDDAWPATISTSADPTRQSCTHGIFIDILISR